MEKKNYELEENHDEMTDKIQNKTDQEASKISEAEKYLLYFKNAQRKDAIIGSISTAIAAALFTLSGIMIYKGIGSVFVPALASSTVATLKFANVASYVKKGKEIKQYIIDLTSQEKEALNNEQSN